MIYFDNAATTLMKPPGVVDAVVRGISSFGGVGRGVHPASLEAGRAVFEARRSVARLLGAPSPSCVSFALNATMALNIADSWLYARHHSGFAQFCVASLEPSSR